VRRLALDQPEGLPTEIGVLLTSYESLTEQIDKLDEELERLAEQDETSKLLMTMPGIGPIAATMFAAHVDDVSRFESGEQLASYLGLVPGEATTGGKVVRTSMIKAGPKQLRSQMVQSAWTLRRSRPNDPIVLWARRIEEKRGKQIAIVALARKMTKVLYAMWKAQKPYDAARASEARASAAS
jgi:transposase